MEVFGLLGFTLASVAYFIFALLIFAARNNSLLAKWILLSAIINIGASSVGALQIKFGFSLQWVFFFDTFRVATWALLILSFNLEADSIKAMLKSQHVRRYLTIWLMLIIAGWATSYLLNDAYKYIFLLFVILNLWTLVLLEQLYRSADAQIRRAIWPLIVGLAATAVFDFVLFSQATMVGGIDFDFWYSRGFIAAAIVPLLLISTRRIKNGSVRIFVSRHVVFYSSMLMIAGLYLLVMALAGYVINYVGGQWGSLISILFLMLSSIVLVVLLLTESLRRKVKVFIAKNFFANKYEYRDEWLDLIEKIETTSGEDPYQIATQIMMSKLGVNKGAIVKQVSERHFKMTYSEALFMDTELEQQLVNIRQFCLHYNWIVDIQEYAMSANDYPDLSLDIVPLLQQKISIIVPIYISKTFYGFFVLAGHTQPLNWEDRDLLFAVSKQLGNVISLHEANEELAESKQFDAFNRMSAFLVHDLKNVQAQLALITSNAEKHRNNPDFIDDVFETVGSATARLDKVLTQLRNKQLAETTKKRCNIAQLIKDVVEQRNVILPKVTIEQTENVELFLETETLHSVLNHLIQNAQEATNKDGWVKIRASVSDNKLLIAVLDNGCGMSETFINSRLFKPFDTTKGNAGMGIGVYEAKQFVESIGGSMQVTSFEQEGSIFQLSLPVK
jgi:putative PEP-CTERM system histidine kinase